MSDLVNDLREAAETFHKGSGYDVLLRVAAAEIERLWSLVAAQDELLVCYRLGRAATGSVLDRIGRLKAQGGTGD